MNVVDTMHSRNAASRCSTVLTLAVLVLVIALTPSITFGQSTSSSIVGTLTDESGAAVPGVAVTVTNVGTGVVRTVETNARGDYSVTALDIGIYEVAAELEGFSRVLRSRPTFDWKWTWFAVRT